MSVLWVFYGCSVGVLWVFMDVDMGDYFNVDDDWAGASNNGENLDSTWFVVNKISCDNKIL